MEKCSFLENSFAYLGHRLDAEGIHPITDKFIPLQNAPESTSVPELRSYLGMVNYHHKCWRHPTNCCRKIRLSTGYHKNKRKQLRRIMPKSKRNALQLHSGSHSSINMFMADTLLFKQTTKPLLGLLKEDKLILPHVSPRIQRWALTLSNYQYRLRYKHGAQTSNADGHCRPLATTLPVPVPGQTTFSLSIVKLNANQRF